MTAYLIDFTTILLPGLLMMLLSALPPAIGTLAAVFHLGKNNAGPYVRNLWAGTASGLVSLGLLSGSLFGTDLSESSTAGLIFLFVPIYSGIGLGIGYGLGALVYSRLSRTEKAVDPQAAFSQSARNFIWVPVAMAGVLIFGMIRFSVQRNDIAVAERATNPETLHWVYAKVERGSADPFSIPLFLAQNPNTPSDLLKKMSKHDHPSVRMFVAGNPNTDPDVIASLKNDCSPRIRKVVEDRLRSSPVSESAPQPTPNCGQPEREYQAQ